MAAVSVEFSVKLPRVAGGDAAGAAAAAGTSGGKGPVPGGLHCQYHWFLRSQLLPGGQEPAEVHGASAQGVLAPQLLAPPH